MKLSGSLLSAGTILLSALGGFAQSVRIISPTQNTRVVAGQPFNATVQFADTTSSVDVLALYFGAKLLNSPAPIQELGQTKLATVFEPKFTTGVGGGFDLDVQLTIPADIFSGLDTTYNLTCGEFFTLGALNTPETFTSQVTLFVASK